MRRLTQNLLLAGAAAVGVFGVTAFFVTTNTVSPSPAATPVIVSPPSMSHMDHSAMPMPSPTPDSAITVSAAPTPKVAQEYPLPNAPAPTRYAKRYPAPSSLTEDQKLAVKGAGFYLEKAAYSRPALIELLVVGEHYDKKDAAVAVDFLKPNWNNEAAQRAKEYKETMPAIIRTNLVKNLVFEGFTDAQAVFGATKIGL